ncbi:MAG TPA: cyclodeaminase/cyclohydrolase family protein [Thermomicrobiales bacterium]|nr:cyclodeaminase/cyclohydrolase family protein [Thermomicrobiales bacterium]
MPESKSPNPTPPIRTRSIGHYLDTLGSSAPTPGGGSATGIIGALGASLGLMVVSLTSADDTEATAHLDVAREKLIALRERFTQLAEQDEAVYQGYRDAAGMPKSSAEEKAARRASMQRALKEAARVPLAACEASVELGDALVPVRRYGNPYLLSDARIAVLCTEACFEASRINVNVNLAMIKDEAWVTNVSDRVKTLAENMRSSIQSE